MIFSALTPATGAEEAIKGLAQCFRSAGIEEWESDARVLVLGVLGIERLDLIRTPDRPVGAACEAISAAARRRLQREPVSRILGRREFWSLSLDISPETLDPRPETETLVEAALAFFADRRRQPLAILDLGSGSGALLCALLAEFPGARGVALDLSQEACAVSLHNLDRHGLATRAEVRWGTWTRAAPDRFDLIVCNPPYIPTSEIARLAPEVKLYDPRLALDGGPDGLGAYREISSMLDCVLGDEGVAVFEVGAGQAPSVGDVFESSGFEVVAVRRDLSGHARAVICRRRAELTQNEAATKIVAGGLGAGRESD